MGSRLQQLVNPAVARKFRKHLSVGCSLTYDTTGLVGVAAREKT